MDLHTIMNTRRYKLTYYPSTLTKQDSYLCVHDLMLDSYQEFRESAVLGAGNHGSVRLFSHGDNKIAVKTPLLFDTQYLTSREVKSAKKDAKNEIKL